MSRPQAPIILAVLILGAVIGLVAAGWLLARSGDPGEPADQTPDDLVAPAPPDLGDIRVDDLPAGRGADAVGDDLLGPGGGWTYRPIDPDTNRPLAHFTVERFEPREQGRFLGSNLTGWVYLDDAHLRVTAGRALVDRKGQDIESGTLSKIVRVEAFPIPAAADPAAPAELPTGEPDPNLPSLGFLETDSLAFEAALGQAQTDDQVVIESPGLRFAGEGMLLRLTDVPGSSRQRLALLRIDRGSELVVTPDELRTAPAGERDDDAEADAQPGPGGTDAHAGPEEFYTLELGSNVVVTAGDARLRADRLSAAVRLLDGRLPPGAVAPINLAALAPSPGVEPGPRRDRRAEDATEQQPLQIRATWTGPLVAELVPDAPPELASPAEHAFVRAESPRTGVVRLTAAGDAAALDARALEYAATSARLVVAGDATGVGVLATADGAGSLRTGRVEADLSRSPLVTAQIPTAGSLVSASGPAGEPGPEVEWSERADASFRLAETPVGALAVLPDDLTLAGAVRARVPSEAAVESGAARLSFDAPAAGERARPVRLARAILADGVRARTLPTDPDEPPATLESELAELFFGPADPAETDAADADADAVGFATPRLRLAEARGNAVVTSGDRSIRADRLAAAFVPGPAGDPELARVDAETAVRLRTGRGVDAEASGLSFRPEGEVAELTGSPARILYEADRDADPTAPVLTAEVEAPAFLLEGVDRRVLARGSGRARYTRTDPTGSLTPETGSLEWEDSFYYDDRSGEGEAAGSVRARRVPAVRPGEPVGRQTGTADLARVALTPFPSGDAEASPDRELWSVVLLGTEHAEVRLERFTRGPAPNAGGPADREALFAVRSGRLELDAPAERLAAPGPGVLVVEDRRPGADDLRIAGDDLRGTSVFDWTGSLTFDRRTGEAAMRGDIRVRHLHSPAADATAPSADRLTEIHCESILVELAGAGGPTPSDTAEVRSIVASDAVYVRHRDLEIVCDRLRFEASGGKIVASAAAGNRVTMLDAAEGRHLTADAVTIDVATGEWVAERVSGLRVSP